MSSKIYTTKTIMGLLDISAARVSQLVKQGIITKLGTNQFPAEAVTQYVRWLRGNAFGKDANVGDTNQQRARLLKNQADEKELCVAEKRGELVSAKEVAREWANLAGNIRAKLLSIPTKAAHGVAAINSISEVEEVLKRHIYEALKEIATDSDQTD